jgi:3-oxoadipate enol-lactonase
MTGMSFARIHGATIHYRHRPAVGRPTVVFANSLGTDMRIWNEVERKLADDYRFVAFDKRYVLPEMRPKLSSC